MIDGLQRWADGRGYRVAWGPTEVVERARAEIAARRESGELEAEFCRDELEFLFEGDDVGPRGTVVVVAIPRPAHRVSFDLDGGRLDAFLPPTYLRYRAIFEEVRQDLSVHGLPGARVELLTAPLKTVAGLLGLIRYGRNNVTYVEGIGSYLQLCGFLTDVALPAAAGAQVDGPKLLSECDGCTICQRACPTRAITAERVLLRAERCLTLANENPGQWPESIPRRAHHCLVGCMACQRACPVNPKLRIEDTGVCFSAAETRSLLDDDSPQGRNAENGVRTKLAWLGQPSLEPVLGRNLRALLDARGRRSSRPSSCRGRRAGARPHGAHAAGGTPPGR